MTSINIEGLGTSYSALRSTESVERKGIGHPDTLCDLMSEAISVWYSKYCLEIFGRIPHHWFDKVLLIGGESEISFGYGRIVKSYQVIVAGKAVISIGDRLIPLDTILNDAIATTLERILKGFNAQRDVRIINKVAASKGPGQDATRYRPASINDLDEIGKLSLVSNDCNICTGYYPLSVLEQIVLEVDDYLLRHDIWGASVGADIKTIGRRNFSAYFLIVNVPFLAFKVSSSVEYSELCEAIRKDLIRWIDDKWFLHSEVVINPERAHGRAYLTVTGSVADTGDVGVTGRGNRSNGLITPSRMMSIEAIAGKNPLDHTGKLYGILAQRISRKIAENLTCECEAEITTAKGRGLNDPVAVNLRLSRADIDPNVLETVNDIVRTEIDNISIISSDFLQQKIRFC